MKRVNALKLFGYESGNQETLLELKEVTAKVDADTAELLGKFFIRCADEMRSNPKWEHLHFDGDGDVDLVIFQDKTR